MTTEKRRQELLDEMQQDFAESVFAEEIDFDTVPAELMAAFGESIFAEPEALIPDEDFWGADGLKQISKRQK